MKQALIVICGLIIVTLPLIFLLYRNWDSINDALIKSKFVGRRIISPQYSAETKTPGMSVIVADTAFLEYIAATMKIYDENAIADPLGYFGNLTNTNRFTVSHLKFELVPTLVQYMVALGGSTDFATRGVYVIEGNTLVVRVSINEEELEKGKAIGQFAMEDIFLDTALQTLIYATGEPSVPISPLELAKLQKAIKDNIPSGIFPRPLRIEK